MKRIMFFVVLALVALANVVVAAEAQISPKTFQSLQPFKSFPKGAGEGIAYEYKSRSKGQFVALLRDKKLAKKEMRVSCETLINQMMEGHKDLDLPFEGCEGAAAAIEGSDEFTVVACKDEMFSQDNWLTVTNENGSAFGVWHRKCMVDEKVLVYKDQPIISLTCLNAAIPVSQAPVPVAPPAAVTPPAVTKPPRAVIPPPPQFAKPSGTIAVCPDVYTLKVNVWEHKAIHLPGVELTNAKEELEVKFAGVSHVSRTHGGQFRKAKADGSVRLSSVERPFRVSLIMTPESSGGAPTIASEQVLGDIAVTGLRELKFLRAQIEQWDAIRLVPLVKDGDTFPFSPPRSNQTGLHELRFFNHLPGKKLGEWENNPVPDCIMNEHWIEE